MNERLTEMAEALIRELGADDVAAYRALRLHALQTEPLGSVAAYEEEAERDLAFFRSRLSGPDDSRVFGAVADGGLVGVAGVFFNDRVKERHKAMLWGVFVAREARGQGLARALVGRVVAHARPRAMTLLAVVSAANEPAKTLYRSMGFVTYGRELRSLRIGDDYVDDDLLALDLRPAG